MVFERRIVFHHLTAWITTHQTPTFFSFPPKKDPQWFIVCLVVFHHPFQKIGARQIGSSFSPSVSGWKYPKKIYLQPPPPRTYSRSKSRGEGIRICFVGCWPETPPKTWVLAASVHETYGGLKPRLGRTRNVRSANAPSLVASFGGWRFLLGFFWCNV